VKIHLWVPGLHSDSGGIESYSSTLLRALQQLCGGDAISVFAKNDVFGVPGAKPCIRCTGEVALRLRTPAFSLLAGASALSERPDLIISTHLHFAPLARSLKKRLGIPYWVSLHGVEAWGLRSESRRRGLTEANLLLPVSGFTRNVVSKEQGISRERFRVLPNAFDPAAFRTGPKSEYLLKRYRLTAEQPVILTVGRLAKNDRYKGHDRVLRVLRDVGEESRKSKVESRNSEVRYLVVGDGDDRARLEALAQELGVRELVTFAGKVPADELCDHYNLCDVFAMPSTGEGFGIVFLEALACGKPVIAGNKDASRDAVLNGDIGALINPDSPEELRNAIVAVLTEVETRKAKASISNLRPTSSGTHLPPILFQPEALQQKVTTHFGFEKFKETLAGYFKSSFLRIDNKRQRTVSEYRIESICDAFRAVRKH
jgi:glycosyltransferase involved in cell wall biosynthesis